MRRRLMIGLAFGVLGLSAVPASGATLRVCASGCTYSDPQAAIDAARYGDTVLLRASETFVVHLVLRAKSGTGWIDVRSDAADSLLPADGVRLVPNDRPGSNTPRAQLARIIGKGGAYKTSPLLRTEPGAHGYRVRFVEFDGVAHIGYETLIQLGEDTAVAPPTDIVLDRVYVHGHLWKGQKRGITLNGTRLSVLSSYISDIKAVNADSQGIAGFNGAGPLTIDNNYIEAAAENILFGGADPAISGLVPSDITVRRNTLTKPMAWRNAILAAPGAPRAALGGTGVLKAATHYFRIVSVMTTGTRMALSAPSTEVSLAAPAGRAVTLTWTAIAGADRYRIYRSTSPGAQIVYVDTPSAAVTFTYTGAAEVGGSPAASGTRWVVKNILEMKNAERVRVDGNILENIWSAGQYGYAIVLTPRNASDTAPWSRVRDVLITNNIVRSAAGVLNLAGYDDTGVTMRTERVTVRNNLLYDIDNTKYGGLAKGFLIGDGPSEVVIDNNTIVHTNSSVLYAYGDRTMPAFTYTDNISLHNKYGIMGSSSSPGIPTINRFFPGGTVTCNVLAGGPQAQYPQPNAFPTVAQWTASFENAAAADYRLRPGSPVATAGCGRTPGVDFQVLDAALSGGAAAPEEGGDNPPAANQAPVARPGGPYTGPTGVDLPVDASASSDPDGSIASYQWLWSDELLVRAASLPASALHGTQWVREAVPGAAGGAALRNPDLGAAKRSSAAAAPASYVEFRVPVAAGVPYRLWMRMQAAGNSYANDSLFVQFSGAIDERGASLARIGTTTGMAVVLEEGRGAGVSGWGWNDGGYGGVAPPIYFAASGTQTIRIQAREDGVAWDQFLLSASEYYEAAPGLVRNDTKVVPDSLGNSTGAVAVHQYAWPGSYPLLLTVTDDRGLSATAETTAAIGTASALVARASGPHEGIDGQALAFDASSSSVPAGSTPAVQWTFGDDIVLHASAFAITGDRWNVVSDASAADGHAVENLDRGTAKVQSAGQTPSSYVEATFRAAAGVPYRVWLRSRAAGDAYANDSAYVQFSGSVTSAGTPATRIGTSDALSFVRQDGPAGALSGWGWGDAAYGTVAAPIYFNSDGLQTVRIQQREDGLRLDHVVISSDKYADVAPGGADNDATIVPVFKTGNTELRVNHTYSRPGVFPVALTLQTGATVSRDHHSHNSPLSPAQSRVDAQVARFLKRSGRLNRT